MQETIMTKLSNWNKEMNGIPRICLLIAVTLLLACVAFGLFPYCWPFVVGLIFSLLLEPFVRLLSTGLTKLKIKRSIATLLGMLILFGVVAVVMAAAVSRLWQELMTLVRSVPQLITWISSDVMPWIRDIYNQYQDILPPYVMDMVNSAVLTLGQTLMKWAGSLSAMLTSGAFTTALSLVDVILSIVMTIMGTYYLTADRSRIGGFLQRTFPLGVRQHGTLIKTNLIRSLFGQLKSQLTVSLIIITFLVSSFMIFGVRYGLLAALVIGLADALPVVGAGLFLIPWSILSFVLGDVPLGIFMACVYIGTIIIRQVLEPRIVGRNLGLYPLATMIAMYAGYKWLGILGLLGGPVLLNLIKVVLEADKIAREKDDGAMAGEGGEAAEAAPADLDAKKSGEAAPPIPAHGEITMPNGTQKPVRIRARK